ncbi:TIGR02221 family CRISPR-associated protein, partial [Sulfurospirillum sp. T05]
VLISTIGTGDTIKDKGGEYKKTTYFIEGKKYPNESLTASALIKHANIDKVFFIGTNKSMWDNLYLIFSGQAIDESYHDKLSAAKNDNGVGIADLEKLETTMNDFLGSSGSRCLILSYAKNDSQEIWQNFYTLLQIKDHLQPGDEIYLDITHGFRYMPMLSIFLMQFLMAREESKLTIKAAYYGMFGEAVSEVLDFKIFFDLLDWAQAIKEFKKYSNATSLIEAMHNSNVDTSVSKLFEQLNRNLQLANLASLWQFFKSAHKKIEHIASSDNKMLSLLSEDLQKLVSRLNKETLSLFQYEIALWFFENKQYALSYLALHEAVVTKACELKYPNKDSEDEALRRIVKNKHIDSPYSEMFLEKKESKKPNYDSISSIRNSIAHQLNDRKDKAYQDIERLDFYLKKFYPYFYSNCD